MPTYVIWTRYKVTYLLRREHLRPQYHPHMFQDQRVCNQLTKSLEASQNTTLFLNLWWFLAPRNGTFYIQNLKKCHMFEPELILSYNQVTSFSDTKAYLHVYWNCFRRFISLFVHIFIPFLSFVVISSWRFWSRAGSGTGPTKSYSITSNIECKYNIIPNKPKVI